MNFHVSSSLTMFLLPRIPWHVGSQSSRAETLFLQAMVKHFRKFFEALVAKKMKEIH